MKKKICVYLLLFTGTLVSVLVSCKKEEPKPEPAPISSITVKDIDGNEYDTITIGTQTWMKENLKTTKLNDGIAISNISNSNLWAYMSYPAYCWKNDDTTAQSRSYGALYNWYTVNTGKLCPKGWHVPTEAEWTTLITYLGGNDLAYGKLKETGTSHWQSPNTNANNESIFTAIPGGGRYDDGSFFTNDFSCWWSSTETSATSAPFFYLKSDIPFVISYSFNKKFGFNVRCIKD